MRTSSTYKFPLALTMARGGRTIMVLLAVSMECVGAGIISVDFDKPRGGPVCVGAAVGDSIKFHWVRPAQRTFPSKASIACPHMRPVCIQM